MEGVDLAVSIGGDVVDGSVVVCFAESNNRLAQVSNEVCCVGCGMVDAMPWLRATTVAKSKRRVLRDPDMFLFFLILKISSDFT